VSLLSKAIENERIVMAGLVPANLVFDIARHAKTWMPAASAGMTASIAG
jgi:hypothetical protein